MTSLAEEVCTFAQPKMAPSSTYMARPCLFQVALIFLSKGEV